VRQAHMLFGGLLASCDFDLDHEVYQGRLMPSAEASALAVQEAGAIEVKVGKCLEGNQE